MGYNTVAFLLNDYSHLLEKSPKTVAWLLANPPHSEEDKLYTRNQSLTKYFNEPKLHFQALEVMPTFHADFYNFYMAGGNCIKKLEVKEKIKKNGKTFVLLELPDWAKDEPL